MRLRQAVIAARDLAAVAGRLRGELRLDEPYADPGVGYFGLCNAVFALSDTFLEVVSPERDDTAAGRLIERRGGDCGYMLMFQVDDLSAARARARERGIREVFTVELDDIAEVHLHPADIGGAIVSLSAPQPPAAWRWGGPGWQQRAAAASVRGATVAVPDPGGAAECWTHVLGEAPSVRFVAAGDRTGLVEIELDGPAGATVSLENVRVVAR